MGFVAGSWVATVPGDDQVVLTGGIGEKTHVAEKDQMVDLASFGKILAERSSADTPQPIFGGDEPELSTDASLPTRQESERHRGSRGEELQSGSNRGDWRERSRISPAGFF